MAEMAARRHGTQSTKSRGQVSGGNSKPWRQKGTGRARFGSTRTPSWPAAGHPFGPHPGPYTARVNPKPPPAARRGALSVHAERVLVGRGEGVGLLADDGPDEDLGGVHG